MAYNKKYAELGESVIDYVNNREDAIEQGFSDVDTDINEVNQELNTLGQDTGWIDFTLLNGNVAQSSGSCAYRKIGKIVYIRMHLLRANYNTIVANIPAGFRPSTVVGIIGLDRNSSEVSRGYVLANGDISLGTFTQQNGFIVCQDLSYPVE